MMAIVANADYFGENPEGEVVIHSSNFPLSWLRALYCRIRVQSGRNLPGPVAAMRCRP